MKKRRMMWLMVIMLLSSILAGCSLLPGGNSGKKAESEAKVREDHSKADKQDNNEDNSQDSKDDADQDKEEDQKQDTNKPKKEDKIVKKEKKTLNQENLKKEKGLDQNDKIEENDSKSKKSKADAKKEKATKAKTKKMDEVYRAYLERLGENIVSTTQQVRFDNGGRYTIEFRQYQKESEYMGMYDHLHILIFYNSENQITSVHKIFENQSEEILDLSKAGEILILPREEAIRQIEDRIAEMTKAPKAGEERNFTFEHEWLYQPEAEYALVMEMLCYEWLEFYAYEIDENKIEPMVFYSDWIGH
ncbi:hypothetical protein EII17_05780 [Clostridiales bacterium COT073_COT-073]|nr:hypothetical protein EII17_05780 [Clostridiales bacterium COT073_COT-073]